MKKLFAVILSLLVFSSNAMPAVYTTIQPPFIVDSESDKDSSWPDKSFVFVKGTGHLYSLESGVFVQMYMSATQNGVTRSLNSSYQISTGAGALAIYSVDIVTTLSLTGGQKGTVTLQISPDNATWQTIQPYTNGNTGSLTIGLNTAQTQTANLVGFVPTGWYVQIITTNVTGTPTYTYKSGQEVTM